MYLHLPGYQCPLSVLLGQLWLLLISQAPSSGMGSALRCTSLRPSLPTWPKPLTGAIGDGLANTDTREDKHQTQLNTTRSLLTHNCTSGDNDTCTTIQPSLSASELVTAGQSQAGGGCEAHAYAAQAAALASGTVLLIGLGLPRKF